MKKLLSILASVGLVTTASTSVVSCSTKSLLLDNAKNDNGKVTFEIHGLKMDDTYDSLERVNSHYSVFDKDGNHIDGAKLSSDGKSFTRGNKYSFSGSFDVPDYKQGIAYRFEFGTFGKDSKMAKKLATIVISGKTDNNGGKGIAPDADGKVTTTFEATIKGNTDSGTLKKLFAIKANGKEVSDAEYSFTPKEQRAFVLADEAPVEGTVKVVFKAKDAAFGTGNVSFTIDTTADGKVAVPGFKPVTVDVNEDAPASDPFKVNIDASVFTDTDKDIYTKLHPLWAGSEGYKSEDFFKYANDVQKNLWDNVFSDSLKDTLKQKLGLDSNEGMNIAAYTSTDDGGKVAAKVNEDFKAPTIKGVGINWYWFNADGTMNIAQGQQNLVGGLKAGQKLNANTKYEFVIAGKTAGAAVNIEVTINGNK